MNKHEKKHCESCGGKKKKKSKCKQKCLCCPPSTNTFVTLVATNAFITNLTVTGTATFATLVATNATITNLTATNGTFVNLNVTGNIAANSISLSNQSFLQLLGGPVTVPVGGPNLIPFTTAATVLQGTDITYTGGIITVTPGFYLVITNVASGPGTPGAEFTVFLGDNGGLQVSASNYLSIPGAAIDLSNIFPYFSGTAQLLLEISNFDTAPLLLNSFRYLVWKLG